VEAGASRNASRSWNFVTRTNVLLLEKEELEEVENDELGHTAQADACARFG